MLEISVVNRFGAFCLDVTFNGPSEGVTAIFGPSGCGKSTLLACVAGLLWPQTGRIAVAGQVLLDTERRVFVPPEQRRCGVVFQDARLFPHLSVETNLRYGARRTPAGEGASFAAVVDLLGLAPLLHRRPGRLSGGERQRVALGRALLARPRLLLLDEPLAALDTARRLEVLPFLAQVWREFRIPMLYVTHALDEVDYLADTLLLLDAGTVLAVGPLEAMALRTDLPLSARQDSGAVLRCEVAEHGPAGRTRLAFDGGSLVVRSMTQPVGTHVRVRIRDRDVLVATELPRGVSVQNVLETRLEAIAPAQTGEVVLRLRIGASALLARITEQALQQLALAPGQTVWALIKSVAIGAG
ncbi:MAG: molybdenum ABC transporter ATP-binding protein [Acetobacteraceae bacterium]|nr:molybdenum ABC transporter ATP-binding protein [Acetobacteraceae bacterium]